MTARSETHAFDVALKGDRTAKAADAMDAEVSLTLSEAQRDALTKFVSDHGRLPKTLEINFKAGIDRAAVIPVTVLVGAMA